MSAKTEASRGADTKTTRQSGKQALDRRDRPWTYRDSDGRTKQVGDNHRDRGDNTPHDVMSA